MRILFFSTIFPNADDPTRGTYNLKLCQALAQRHEVRVVSPRSWLEALRTHVNRLLVPKRSLVPKLQLGNPDPRSSGFADPGSRSFPSVRSQAGAWERAERGEGETKFTVVAPTFYYPPKLLRSEYGRFLWWSVRRLLLDECERFRPQAVVSYWTHPDGEVAVRFARRVGVPAIAMVGGSDVLVLTNDPKRRQAVQRVLQQADAVVAVSRNIARCVGELGVSADNVHVVHRGIDRAVFHPGDRTAARRKLGIDPHVKVLVSAGRLAPVKGYPVLIEAARRLAGDGLPIVCYVLGGGPSRGELERQIDQNGLCGVVRLAGPQRQHDLADWFRAADLVVLPSLSEGIPNVLLEAIACGTPFVASDVGGVGEIADPLHDRLVPPGDAAALAAAIADRLVRPMDVAPRCFEPWRWEESAERLSAIIADCVGIERQADEVVAEADDGEILDEAEIEHEYSATNC